MNQNGHDHIAEVPFQPSATGLPGVDVWDFIRLGERAGQHGFVLDHPLRAEFHHLITVRHGALDCQVDGTGHTVEPGAWLWIRPGQVYRFPGGLAQTEGVVLLFMPGFLDTATTAAARMSPPYPDGPLIPTRDERRALDATLELLHDAHQHIGDLPLDVHVALVRHLLITLLLRLGHLTGRAQQRDRGGDTFRRFHDAAEHGFTTTRQVEEYATALGYSSRTITRACLAATGRTAKQYLDDRAALEAKRLLFHTSLTPAQIARRLGFTSPTVFGKFFRRCTGETPAGYRARLQAGKHRPEA